MTWYVLASLGPAVVLVLACALGGLWPVLALAQVTLVVWGLDRFRRRALAARAGAERAATRLNVALGLVFFVVLASGIAALGRGPATPGDIALFMALALYLGQVGNSNAHELIHKPGRVARGLGVAVYVAMLFGHHASAHPQVHHVWVASPRDPNSARRGEGFYRFWGRATVGSFRAGWAAETARRARGRRQGLHPYAIYLGGAALCLLLAWGIGGARGLAAYLGLALYCQMQLMLSDYVQHYGLRRRQLADGRLEPVGPRHSWNAAPWYSGAMMLNAPRHSDHHQHPARAFPELDLSPTMPMLPWSLPVMAAIATCPPLWRSIMDPRLAAETRKNSGASLADLASSQV